MSGGGVQGGGDPRRGAGLRRRPGAALLLAPPRRPVALAGVALLIVGLAVSLVTGCARPAPPATPPPQDSASGTQGSATTASPPDAIPEVGSRPPAAGGAPAGVAGDDAPAGAHAPEAPVPPLPSPSLPDAALTVRVGLASDLARVELPCCGADWSLVAAGQAPVALTTRTVVEPGSGVADRAVYRLQVAALRDDVQAAALADRLARRWGWPADAHFDAGVGLYRVRLGRFAGRPDADAAQRRLAAAGEADAWVVSEGGDLSHPSLRVVRGGRAATLPGRWLRVAGGEPGLPWDGHVYRGDLLLFLNPRGTLNVINELPLEDYLRGVVPAEMGPVEYDRLEALKAQAVAARTYTLRNLGGFRDEGYDLCATPRCQVYGGRGAEHPLSDRAVAATAGQVMLYGDEPVDARYSATCGGHTEDVAVVFPSERADYLRGVPCIEGGLTALPEASDTAPGALFPDALTRRLLPPPAGLPPAAALTRRLDALAARAGLPAPSATVPRPASAARGEVVRYVSALFDLALGPRVLLAADDLPRLAASPPAEWSAEERRQAELLVASGLYGGDPRRPLDGREAERLLFQLAQVGGVLRGETAAFREVETAADGGRVLRLLPAGSNGEQRLPLGPDVATFRLHRGVPVAGDLRLAPGDPVALWRSAGRLVAVVQEVEPGGTADPPHKRSRWSRYRSDAQLAAQVEARYPGLGFTGFQVLSRGVSGRVGAIRLLGRGGKTLLVEGLAVRWTLDLPDTRFTVERAGQGYRFLGSGWGHGVGLCQAGSFAMAGRGLDYRQILQHYYTGVSLVRARPRAERWQEPAPLATAAAR